MMNLSSSVIDHHCNDVVKIPNMIDDSSILNTNMSINIMCTSPAPLIELLCSISPHYLENKKNRFLGINAKLSIAPPQRKFV